MDRQETPDLSTTRSAKHLSDSGLAPEPAAEPARPDEEHGCLEQEAAPGAEVQHELSSAVGATQREGTAEGRDVQGAEEGGAEEEAPGKDAGGEGQQVVDGSHMSVSNGTNGSGGLSILRIERSADVTAGDMLDLSAESSDLLEGKGGEEVQEIQGEVQGGQEKVKEGGREACEGLTAGGTEKQLVQTIKILRLGELAALAPAPAPRAQCVQLAADATAKDEAPASARSPNSSRTPRGLGASGHSNSRKFSFSAPPHIPRPKTAVRHNYSHSPARVRQILQDNEALVQRLGEITYSGSRLEQDAAKHDKVVSLVLAGSAARRQSEASRIVRQNLELYKRLQAVKPSRAVSRKEHRKSFAKSREYVANITTIRQGAGAEGAGLGARRASVAAPPRAPEPGAWAEERA